MLRNPTAAEWRSAEAAIAAYGKARHQFRSAQEALADCGLLQGNDNKVGAAGEFWAIKFYVSQGYEIIEVPVDEYWDLALNGVTLAPGKVVMNAGSPTVVRELERHDVEVIQVDFSESHRFAIAGLHCATLELVRDQDPD